ncbi:MAG: CYTH domain-containing protein [Candidatus Eisenbacteria bacterium]|nr:CYTH domain-containing protein [Candidatus Eisenbacteria bacterium]
MKVEREAKLRLTAEEASRIDASWGPPRESVQQENLYLDTPTGALQAVRGGLRLRRERLLDAKEHAPGRVWLTFKGPSSEEAWFAERSERERRVEAAEAQRILDLLESGPAIAGHLAQVVPRELRARIAREGLRPIGRLINERRTYLIDLPSAAGPRTVAIEVDRVRFPDGAIEYELEIEWPPESGGFPERAVRERLVAIGVGWRPETRSKLARLLSRSEG